LKIKHINGEMLKKMFILGNNSLYKNRDVVDALNVFPVPDGDTGTNMSLTLDSALNEILRVKDPSIENVAKSAAKGSLMGARGNSGVILSQILRGFEKGCKGKEMLNVVDFANALKQASNTAYKAVMKPIEGTILTIIRETSERALQLSNDAMDFNDFLSAIISYGDSVLDKTPDMLDVLKQANVVDAGGKGLIFILNGFLEAISGKEVSQPESREVEPSHKKEVVETNIEFGYCTEFIIQGDGLKSEGFKDKIKELGDSLIVVGDDDLIKVHIHTNNPGKVIEFGLNIGELIDIKIDNMRHQHNNRHITEEDSKKEIQKYGFITVAMGEGISSIFKDLNIDRVIEGGQTMNPSTEDILKAVNEIHADNIFVLPNNSNIILAANQAKELSNKNVIVVPAKTVPQGITAMLEFDPTSSPEENEENMTKSLTKVNTVQITYSVRDSKFNDLEIKKDDILGILNGDIDKVGNDVSEVAIEVLDKAVNDDHEILTIYYGEDISEEQADELASLIEEKYEELDVEVYYGGQPLYYYIFSIE
jgi:DAK2 domain fusion protein YloV